jgi:ATP-dependent DNA helicase RecG
MTVDKRIVSGCEMAVVIVQPSDYPPVRFNGRIWIRVGPRRATASAQEEQRLNEKRLANDLPFDLHPVTSASVADLDTEMFSRVYLPAAVAPDVIQANDRTIQQQMSSLRFLKSTELNTPTIVGLLAAGKDPCAFVPGAYIQFLRVDGTDLSDPIADQKEIYGPLPDLLRRIDEVVEANIRVSTDVRSGATEIRHPDYPLDAFQQLMRNAVMHRDYATSNAPVRITWFNDRCEIQNPGGPFGQVTVENFGCPGVTDYRNPNIAEVMRNLGYVQRFGVGIAVARKSLQENGNPEPRFDVQSNHVLVTVRKRL